MQDFNTISKLANYAIAKDDFETAVTLLEKIADTKHVEVLTNLGVCYSKLEKYDKAMNCFNLVLAESPTDFFALSNKANVLHKQQQNRMAIAIYQNLLKLFPNNQDLLKNLSIIQDADGQKETSANTLTEIIANDPNDYKALNDLGVHFATTGNSIWQF